MNKERYIQVDRELLNDSINRIHANNLGFSEEVAKNLNARRLVACLSGQLAAGEPEVSNALWELLRPKPIV